MLVATPFSCLGQLKAFVVESGLCPAPIRLTGLWELGGSRLDGKRRGRLRRSRRAPWIDLDDLRDKGAMLVWTQSDPRQVPAAFAAIAPSAEIGTPFDLPMRRNDGVVHVGWAILKPR